MIPLTIQKNRYLLQEAGSHNAATFFQWFNLASTVTIK